MGTTVGMIGIWLQNLANDSNLDGQLMPGLSPNGVPRGLSGTAIPFEANSIDSIKDKIRGKENEVAAIVIEPARGEAAEPRYLQALKDLAEEIGAVLIFDEITSGFRQCVGGLHILSKVAPDIAVFAKSIANGYPIGVVMGREAVCKPLKIRLFPVQIGLKRLALRQQ